MHRRNHAPGSGPAVPLAKASREAVHHLHAAAVKQLQSVKRIKVDISKVIELGCAGCTYARR